MDQIKTLSKHEKRIILSCIICMLLCLAILTGGQRYFWGDKAVLSNKPKIGTIVAPTQDIRHRSKDAFVWYKANDKDGLRLGDSVFSGAGSKLHVDLEKGGGLDIGENSLVVFNEIENQNLANLMSGNFRLKVEGNLKVAINGEVTTFSGKNSEVQLFFGKDKKPQVRLLKGQAKITNKNGISTQLDARTIASIYPENKISPPPVEIPKLNETPTASYIWHLYDLYQQNDLKLSQRKERPHLVNLPTELKWSQIKNKSAKVQVSDSEDFKLKPEISTSNGVYSLGEVHLGDNFWRVSLDQGKNWSLPQKFVVETKFLNKAQPILLKGSEDLPLLQDSLTVALGIRSPVEALGYVAEASLSPDFKPEETKIFWSPDIRPRLSFYRPGQYFYRFRTVAKTHELSDWSVTKKFTVFRPQRPLPPVLASINKRDLMTEEPFQLSWNSNGTTTVTELYNATGEKIKEFEGTNLRFSISAPGVYKVRSFAANSYRQVGPSSKVEILAVRPKPVPLKLAKVQAQPRKPSSVEGTSSGKFDNLKEVVSVNQKYKDSQVSVQTFLWTLQTSQQYYQSETAPVVTGVGVHGINWQGSWGFEGSLKLGALPMNPAGKQTSLKDAEARMHYRFLTGFPFGFARELQTSFFGGYEIYRNSGGLYSSRYDLVKFGTSLEFPLWAHWSAGGGFVYGLAGDQSTQQEISGHLNYFLSRDWSLGLGYRLNYFNAGSAAAAPDGFLPYKEAYTEGYSILNYHF